MDTQFEIFLVGTPGLDHVLLAEAVEAGFVECEKIPGGVRFTGGWPDVWRANLMLRGATRVLARIGEFRAFHLAQLDKRARKFPWSDVLRPDVPVRVEVTSRKSKIYHAGAATQRIETALKEELGVPIAADAPVVLKVRIEDDLCTISVDTSGESLHKRGHKVAVNKAPMRETMAALLLRECGYLGQEPVYDPMCGSGTFVIEAAEVAMGLAPGRSRTFAFEHLATFDPEHWSAMRDGVRTRPADQTFHGSDRDDGAIRMSLQNADRAGVSDITSFERKSVSDITPPTEQPGLIILNPPYGARIGDKKPLFALYGSLRSVLLDRFSGWRVAIVTTDPGLAKATQLPFARISAPIAHGGLKVKLYQTKPLP